MHAYYLPGLAAGLIVVTYWSRVLRMAFKSRFEYGQPAQLIPREPLGKALRLIWFPLVFLWIAVPVMVFGGAPDPALRLLYNSPIAWLGVAISAAALWGTLICWNRMGRDWRMGIDPAEKNHLIVTGPYAYVRHPIYALSQVMMLATVIAVPTIAMIGIAVVHVLLLQWEARREERHLLSVHGDEYARYLRAVGRFVPCSLTPYSPPPPKSAEA